MFGRNRGNWHEITTDEFQKLLVFLGEDRESKQITQILTQAAEGEDMSWFDERCEEEHNMSGVNYIRYLLLQRGFQAVQEEESEQQRRDAKKAERQVRKQEQARQAEENRLEQQRLRQENERLIMQARQQAARREEADRAADKAARKRLAEQKQAEQLAKREREVALEKERTAAQRRIAAERERAQQAEEENRLLRKRLEAERQRVQLEAEQKRIKAEREKRAEKARIAAEKQEAKRQEAERVRIAAEQEAERKAAEKREAEARMIAEKQEAERRATEASQRKDVAEVPEPTEVSVSSIDAVGMPTTGAGLRTWRLQQKLSEVGAASLLGVSRSTIYQSEHGEGPLGAKVMEALRRKFGLLEPAPKAPLEPGPAYDLLLGSTEPSLQYGILGEADGKLVAMDLNQTHTLCLFGVQGSGKSYTLGMLMEMATMPIPRLNHLPNPAATLLFHYSGAMEYAPEFTSMAKANQEASQLQVLKDRYGVEPKALEDLVLLVPADKLEERQLEYPGLQVHPLKFASSELQASHWRFLMGAVGNTSVYIQQLNRIMRQMRNGITLEGLRKAISASSLSDGLKDLANQRLDLASEFIDDQNELGLLLKPGRLLIVDLRDEFLEKDQALGLFVVMMQIFSEVSYNGASFNKLVVFDEAHKYVKNPDLVGGLVESIREMRHKGMTILVASQDPPSVPLPLIELSSEIFLHRFTSPSWLKHIQKANAALSGLTSEQMANLQSGEAYVWSSKATHEGFSKGAKKLRCRPRVTQHGGETKLAVR